MMIGRGHVNLNPILQDEQKNTEPFAICSFPGPGYFSGMVEPGQD
jgi:hypothetical protein